MARPKKPTRLYQRPDTGEWIIRDGGKDTRTGHRGDDARAYAEAALARYLTNRGRAPAPVAPDELPVCVLLEDYATAKTDSVADPDRLDYAILALAGFWTGKTVKDIHRENCQAYQRFRCRSRSTVRRELSVLRAAVNFSKERLTKIPDVWLPAETDPRPDWLTRAEFASVLKQLWRHKRSRHAARLAVCQFYTGSRPATVSKTTYARRTDGPWVDLEQEIWWRRGDDEARTKKERKPHRIPSRLLAHLRRWRRLYETRYIVEHPRHPGRPVGDIGKALETACDRANVARITPHGLKHTAITLFIQSGGSIEAASEYFSTSPETIRRTYWHHSPLHQQAIVERVSDLGRTRTAQKRPETSANQ